MKLIANIARILVGIEFIFSGFVKVVDPYGTGLKLQEYFEVFAEDLPALSGFFELLAGQAQFLSLVFCAAELILGVALLFSFKMKKTAWIVLGLMAFFTFLTFYSAYFNKVTDCGCFGDFLHLKPWHSFYKDIFSVAVILIIFAYRKKYNESFLAKPATFLATIIAFGIGLYAKRYLPILDFLPYAEGKSLPKQMEPTGVKPIIEYTFLDKDENKEIESIEYLMDTARYKYVSSIVLNEDDLKPKITDYAVSDIEGNDYTQESFNGKKMLIIFKKTDGVSEEELSELSQLGQELAGENIESMVLTSLILDDFKGYFEQHKLPGNFYNTDEKVLKAMARTNPVIYVLNDGVVKGKWSGHNIPSKNEVLEILD
ncbi:BT_3928 family protein [Jiulongibacter sediminis]|uniref:Doxx family protein n=1 Tax=Jiulongibacter sediminis TaxID=1605367 RepID=A0A0N8H9B6_9BACT|nr:BT_3928 family protein [Jiulongibacter sediminis]KPM46916.1 doxx family protein [Jiulongibacter sediminis]TBX22263.1 doxx family protein [Jiulongibacter sediminis]